MERDRFGNEHGPGLPFARGKIVTSTEDDFRKLQQAWRLIEARVKQGGPDSIYNFSGLEHGLPLTPDELSVANDFVAPALYFDRFRSAALDHLGGSAARHDAALFSRLTGATYATHLTLVKPGDVVVGISPSHSHVSVVRAVAHAGAKLIDTRTLAEFSEALERESSVSLVVLTRLAVTYELMPIDEMRAVVRLAQARSIPVYVDDAGGARVGPALFDHPRALELGVDVVATGLDKYGTVGPRLGVLAGDKALVSRDPRPRLRDGARGPPAALPGRLSLAGRLHPRAGAPPGRDHARGRCRREEVVVGRRVHETPIIAELLADDILEMAMERAGLRTPPIAPIEATAALAMLLLRDHGMMTVHFVGLPPGTSALMLKFIPPETLARFGGAPAYAQAVDDALTKLARIVGDSDKIRGLLFGVA